MVATARLVPAAVLRRAGAVVLVLLLLAFTVLTYTVLPICREAPGPESAPVVICGPVSVADLPLIGMMLIVALALLWPDLSEAAVPGLISVKRQVAREAMRTDELTDQVRHVETRIVSPRTIDSLAAAAVQKTQGETENVPAVESPVKAETRHEFMAAWASIFPYLALPIGPGAQSSASEAAGELKRLEGLTEVSPLDLSAIRMWRDTYAEELGDLRLLRNSVAHAPHAVPDEGLRTATDVIVRIRTSLFSFRDRMREAEEQ